MHHGTFQRWSGLCAHGRGLFQLWLWRGLVHQLFPVAAFLDARAHSADLGILLDDEIRPALRAGLGNGHVRCGEIAVGIARAAVKHARPPAASGAAATNEFALVAFGAFNPQRDRPRVLALWIRRASDEFTVAAVFLHQALAAC